jgi:hypothetical protein
MGRRGVERFQEIFFFLQLKSVPWLYIVWSAQLSLYPRRTFTFELPNNLNRRP